MNNVFSKFIALLTFAISMSFVAYAQPKNSLSQNDWKLVKIEGEKVTDSRAYIKFNESKNRVNGNGGCNAFGGTLAKDKHKIKISQVISTKMACQQGLDVEINFLQDLAKVTKYSLSNGNLRLYAGDSVILEFKVKN